MTETSSRLRVLDGWRAISILCVLAGHLLPLGPKAWGLNSTVPALGMSLFFTLSGFLITSTLLERPDIRTFFIRRACRILPLALVYLAVALLLLGVGPGWYIAHYTFTINYQHAYITTLTSHFWSLCVEVHFYVFVGLLVAMTGRKGLLLLPFLCAGVTALRVYTHTHVSIVTHLRVDEILAGATVALIQQGMLGFRVRRAVAAVPLLVLAMAFLVVCHPAAGPLQYLRPYLGAATVASTLWRASACNAVLAGRRFKYIADISYALYVIHGIFRAGWFAGAGTMDRYLVKRPLGIALTFLLAHLSTFYFESWWIGFGKRLAARKVAGAAALEVAR